MDILRQLTRQFRAQDISDRSSSSATTPSLSSSSSSSSSNKHSTSSFATSSTTILRMKGDYIVDSGTASDEEEEEDDEEEEEGEVAGIFLPDSTTGAGHAAAAALNNNTDDFNNEVPVPNRDSNLLLLPCNVIAWNPLPTSAQRSPVIMTSDDLSSSSTSSSSPFSSFGRRPAADAFPTMTSATIDPPPSLDGRHSVSTSSDYERCSLDFEAASSCSSSSSSSELELFHSSGEEELAAINRDERRKRSRMSDDSSVFSDDDDDDDEEVNELFGRKNEDELLLRGGISVRLPGGTLLEASEVGGPGGGGGGGGGRGVSPRKRYRRDCSWGVAATTAAAAASVGVGSRQRPSLDFYKMQKTCMIRKHHTINRPRLVKLWIVNGSQRPPKATLDPSPFCFRSLSWTQRNTGSDSPHQTR